MPNYLACFIKSSLLFLLLFSAPFISNGQWNSSLSLSDSTYLGIYADFSISTYGDSGVCIFGSRPLDGPALGEEAIDAEIDPHNGFVITSSAPRNIFPYYRPNGEVLFSFPNQDRVLVRERYLTNSFRMDSVSLRLRSNDSVLAIYEGDWKVIDHMDAQAGTEVWLFKMGDGLICKKIDLRDASELQYLDLEQHLPDSLFDAKNPPYLLSDFLVDGSEIVLEFVRFDQSLLNPNTGLPYNEQVAISLDTVSWTISKSKYARVSCKHGVGAHKQSDRVLFIDETSIRDMTDTTMLKSLVLQNYADNSLLSISFKAKFYINIHGYETLPGSVIYTQNGYYLMITSTINFPPNGRNLDGVRFALFDSTGQVLYDIQTNNEWSPMYYNQVRISKKGEVYFNIQEDRPVWRSFFGKIDLEGNNPLFVKSPLSRQEIQTSNSLFSIFPNPASSYLEVVSNWSLEEIRIVNCFGQLVYSSAIMGKQHFLKTASFARGLHFVTVRSSSGLSETRKVLFR